jgi:hypothetical protein
MPGLYRTQGRDLILSPHPGQYAALTSKARIVLVLAGTQGGKTALGPAFLYDEIQRRGPGDYLVVTPSYPLLERKALPEFRRYFESTLRLGRYTGSPTRRFIFSGSGELRTFGHNGDVPTQVLFGHADDPDSLESATAQAAWLDEAGQRRFKQASYEAILRRLSLAQGRILITTTPYGLGWLKRRLYDPWLAAAGAHPEIDVIQFDSLRNPAFPPAEYARARRDLPPWKFDLFYRGQFTRPAGLIFDCFDAGRHVIPADWQPPPHWPRALGLDFGGVHTAGIFCAIEPRGDDLRRLWIYREYLAGGRTAAEHTTHLLRGEPGIPQTIGGSASEGQWRAEFASAGLPVRASTVRSVEVGIDRVYGAFKRDEVRVSAACTGLLDQLSRYSRVPDEVGEPTEQIADKSSFHFLDSLRYVCGCLCGPEDLLDAEQLAALAEYVG